MFTVASKGISANLLQSNSKRRRTKQQIKDEKAAAVQEAIQTKAKLTHLGILESKVKAMENQKSQGDAAINLLSQFMNEGVVQQEEDGSFAIQDQSGVKRFRADQGQ
jgi:hypothetical protein